MAFARATLIKRITDDGLAELGAHHAIGKTFRVDLNTIHTRLLFNGPKKKAHYKQLVLATMDNGLQRWIPTELLKFEES